MRKKLLHLLRTAPLALLFAGVAFAQTTGTIIGVVTDASTGKPVAGAVIIARSPALQGEQTAVTDASGNYRITLLPPGDYRLAVQLEGFKPAERSDITIRMDKTIRANLAVVPEAVQMEEQVVKTGLAPVVNVGSAEAGAVVSREFIASVPVARGIEQVAAVAPTAKMDQYGVSFAGAQSPENQYIVDGLNTTDPAYGTRAGRGATAGALPALRTNFVQELDVKTGNFSAEYGRATGGILNAVLKSGSNEYHGSVFSTFTPSFLFEPSGKAIGPAGQAIAYNTKPSEGAFDLDFGAEVGGPVLKDKLWFYGGFSPVIRRTEYNRFLRENVMSSGGACPAGYAATGDVEGLTGQCVSTSTGEYLQNKIPGTDRTLRTQRTTYQWVGKLTYLINENNNLAVSAFGMPSSRSAIRGGFRAGGTLYTAQTNELGWTDDGQSSVFARYGGKFLDKRLITEAQVGWFRSYNTPTNKTLNGTDQFATPSIEWLSPLNVNKFESVPAGSCTSAAACPVFGYTTGGLGYIGEYTTDRYSARASAAYLFDALGAHNVKGGVDLERLDYDVTQRYAGGAYYLYTGGVFSAFRGYGTIQNPKLGADGTTLGIDLNPDGSLPAGVTRGVGKNKSRTDSFAYYVQDSWQVGVLPNVTVNYGLRLETQSMKNLDFASTGFDIKDNWSPRVQAIWDFTGNGRGKVAGSWGRFYYAMPLDMGNRAFGGEISLRYNLDPASCGFNGSNYTFNPRGVDFPFQGSTTSCTVLPRSGVNNDIRLTGGTLTPADSGLKGQYVDQFGAQAEYELLSDLSVGVEWQARRQGNVIEDMSSNDGGTYYIGNPGSNRNVYLPDGSFAGNTTYVTTFDPATGRDVNITFPKPERSYDGVTLKVTKGFSKGWLAAASYTYSVLRGNYAGPYRPEDGQLDPGITSEYDLASLMANKKGYLPGDQTHAIKLFGSYTYNVTTRIGLTASGAYNGISGTPVNVLGAHPDYGSGQAFIVQRGQGGRTPWVNTFDIGGAVQYTFRPPYALNFRVDIFNLFNSQTANAFDEDYTFDTVQPVAGLDCKGRNSAGKANPGAALRADCPDLAYLKTVDGRPVTPNPNWGRPAATADAFQLPLSVRFSASLSF